MSTIARGVAGRLLAGYHVAARLGPWDLSTPDEHFADGRWTATATPQQIDAFWIDHDGSFRLELEIGSARWRWNAVEVETGERFTIRGHGAPEVIHAA